MAIHLRSISEYDKLTSEDDVLNVIMNSTSAIAEVSYTNTSNSNLSTFQFDLKEPVFEYAGKSAHNQKK